MIVEESGESTELNSYHCNIREGFGAGRTGFIVSHQTPVAHEPGECPLHHPSPRQWLEASRDVWPLNYLNFQSRPETLEPGGKRLPFIAAVHPDPPQPTAPTQYSFQQAVAAFSFRRAGRRDADAQQQPQRVHQDMPLASLDSLGGVVAHHARVGIGFNALAVENGRGGPRASSDLAAYKSSKTGVNTLPGSIADPFSKEMVYGFPWRKLERKQTPRNASLGQIENCIDHLSTVGRRTSGFLWRRQDGLEHGPLSIGKVGFINSGFHRFDRASAKISPYRCNVIVNTILCPTRLSLVIAKNS